MHQGLDELLQRCTVKLTVTGKMGWGSGFFVAPGLILTCAHVIKDGKPDTKVQIRWQKQEMFAETTIANAKVMPPDLALLKFTPPPDADLPCVYLDETLESGNELYFFGYPDQDFPNGCPVTLNCEGFTGDDPPLAKFKWGQVRPGMSGSPLLNCRTGKVCGIVKFTRNRTTDLGGGAIPTQVILEQFPRLKELQQKFHQQDRRWSNLLAPPKPTPRTLIWASVVGTLGVVLLRFLGALQPLEILSYDLLMSWRRSEDPDKRIAVVEIVDLKDIKKSDDPEISYEKLLSLLRTLQEFYKPQVIGLDVYVDQKKEKDYKKLVDHIAKIDEDSNEVSDNSIPIIASCRISSKDTPFGASEVPVGKLGFTNVPLEDLLGFNIFIGSPFIRRYLYTVNEESLPPLSNCKTTLSFGLQIALEYLESKEGIEPILDKENRMDNGQGYIEFKQTATILKDLSVSGGGYRWRSIGEYETLLNYRATYPVRDSFFTVNAKAILEKKLDTDLLKDRVVLIGYNIENLTEHEDIHYTPYSFGRLLSLGERLPGVQIHAHAVSQIISAVVENRLQIVVWPWWSEILWIGCCSLIGGGLVWIFPLLRWFLLGLAASVPLFVLCWLFLSFLGWWVPFIPSAFAVALTAWAVHKMTLSVAKKQYLSYRRRC